MAKTDNLDAMRHTTAHIMAAAVKKIFSKVKFGIGPTIEDGFYYDFDLPKPLKPEDLVKIEAEMKKIIDADLPIEHREADKNEALKAIHESDQPYKKELVENIEGQKVSFYKIGGFEDLCAGPHLKKTGEVGPFKLLSIAGAYWRGKETNPMLQRIYGTAWETEAQLKDYLAKLAEAEKRDHRKIGEQMDLFSFHPTAPGMAFWHPKGKIIFEQLVTFCRNLNKKYDYQEIATPNVLKLEIWQNSGHYDHYKDAMYFVGGREDANYAIRPMGCPGAITIYKSRTHSYRELPIRLAEFDTLIRKELSGTLHGLLRLQQFTQDDAHIFLKEDQILEEMAKILKIVDETYKKFNLKYKIKLSTQPADSMGEEKTWKKAEDYLKKSLEKSGLDFEIKAGEGAFYGPKIDLDILDALGREWQCGTIQLDFQMPEKFQLEYIDEKGKCTKPVMIHRVILGSIDRFMGILLEDTAGNLPPWLSPVQMMIIPISEKTLDYGCKVWQKLQAMGIRADIDMSDETIGKKIRQAELQKVPYILVVGPKEVEKSNPKEFFVAVRERAKGDLGIQPLSKLITNIIEENKTD